MASPPSPPRWPSWPSCSWPSTRSTPPSTSRSWRSRWRCSAASSPPRTAAAPRAGLEVDDHEGRDQALAEVLVGHAHVLAGVLRGAEGLARDLVARLAAVHAAVGFVGDDERLLALLRIDHDDRAEVVLRVVLVGDELA